MVDRALDVIAHRGPDGRGLARRGPWTLGHVRLAVLDPTPASDQPFTYGRTTVTYTGECWDFTAQRASLPGPFTTAGDTEVVAAGLDAAGGDFWADCYAMQATAWVTGDSPDLFLARDPFGEMPLHVGWTRERRFVYASELVGILALGAVPASVRWFPPGEVWTVLAGGSYRRRPYVPDVDLTPSADTLETAVPRVRHLLAESVAARRISDVPVSALLSGGIDSSAVLAQLAPHVPGLTAYTAVLDPKATDLRMARLVADHVGVPLVEVTVEPPTADDLAATVGAIEQPSKAQTEIGWACLALARRMAGDGVKVTFSGEGSDELWASYGMAWHQIQRKGWHQHRRDSFYGQHRKNFPRVNKVFMRHGVEARMPFLHPRLVAYGLRLAKEAVYGYPPTGGAHTTRRKEKWVLRAGFTDLLPREVISRNKVAFQTGAGLPAAAARVVADPQRFYRAEFTRQFAGVKP